VETAVREDKTQGVFGAKTAFYVVGQGGLGGKMSLWVGFRVGWEVRAPLLSMKPTSIIFLNNMAARGAVAK
jgi:hypothetical protein